MNSLHPRTVLAFLGGALVLHVLLSIGFAFTIGREHDARNMDARWLAGPRPAAVMIAGDSHARYAVEAPVLGAAVNVAVPGEHYLKSMYRVPWLLDHGTRRVGTVVLPFDAISFASFKAESFAPEYVWGRYIDWFELGRIKNEPLVFLSKWFKADFAPYVGEFDTIEQYVTASKHFRDPTGTKRSALTLSVSEGGETVARRHLADAEPWDPVMEAAFRRLVGDLVRRGIHVVLVRFPVTRDYAVELERLGADPSKRAALYGEIGKTGVVDQLDYEKMFWPDNLMFADGDHLNPIGKHRFSEQFARDLVALGVLGSVGGGMPNVPDEDAMPPGL